MPTNPPKSKPPEDLAEVERALSVLQGRHPEHERTRREDEERKAARRAEIDATARVEARKVTVRRMLMGVFVAVLGGVAVVTTLVIRRELARRGRIESATDPYLAHGFVVVESSARTQKIEASVPAGCLLAVSTSDAPLRLVRPGGTEEGPGPLLTCLCEAGTVTLTTSVANEGLGLLRADASVVGGSRALSFLPFKAKTTSAHADQACEEASLDAWLDARHLPATPAVDAAASDRFLETRPALRDAGFKLVTSIKGEIPFGTLEVPAESCAIALGGEGLGFRTKGGALAVGPTSKGFAWCTASAASVLVQHDDRTAVDVLIAPALRVGGLYGASEAARLAGITLATAAIAPADRGWSAKQLLLASAVPETLIAVANAPDLGNDADARVVALSLDRPNGLQPDLGPDVYSFCDPPLATSTSTICIFSGPQKWRIDGAETSAGLARAKLPFWLFGLKDENEPAALKAATQLVTFARKLRHLGFEPTTIEAMTELEQGVEVLGRANEDAMIAVTVAPVTPWIHTYTDGPEWTLDGEPRVVPIKPLERVTVRSNARTLPTKSIRHTVVFRHRP